MPTPAGPALQVTPSNLADGPVTADLGGGQTLVVWQQGLGPSNIMAQVYDASGAVGPAFEITPVGGDIEMQPKVASRGDGSFAITWVQDDGSTMGGGDIHTAFFEAGSTTPIAVVTTAQSATLREADPTIAAVGNNYVVTWAVDNLGGGADIFAQR